MKTTAITLHGKVIQLPNNARVLYEISDTVCDPLSMLSKAAEASAKRVADAKAAGGLASSQPTLVDTGLSSKQCILALRIGCRHAGVRDTDDELDDAIHALGVSEYLPLAFVYLTSLVEGETRVKESPKAKRVRGK